MEKAANDLLKKATKANQTQTRDAALQILLSLKKENSTKLLLSALKDGNKEYRNAALNFASDFANKEVYIEVMKAMQKAKPEVKVDIINWIGREAKCPSKHDVIKSLELRFDLTAMQVLLAQLKDSNFDVKQATVWTLVKIGDKQVIPVLAELLTSDNKDVILLGQDALAAFNGDIDQAVARAIPSATDAGKIAGAELLAMRKATANLTTVLELIKSGSPEVKKAAYTALKDVVSEGDLVNLCGMLETADASAVAPIQQAVISAISSMSPAKQKETITRRMLQAGESKKYLYYIVLATTGEKDALATIVDGFHKGSGAARDAAFEALLNWKGIEAADELYAICKDASSSAYLDRALKAYVKLVSNPAFTGENRLLSLRKAMEVAKTDEQKNIILKQVERTGTFLGMLYAGEFLNQKPVQQAAANAVMNIALGNKEYYGANVRELLNKVMQVLDNPDAGYQKEAIKKHLAEMPQGEGFISIFNGKDLSGWKGLVQNPIARAKMKPAQLEKAQEKADEIMRSGWSVNDGMLVFNGKGDNLCTDKQYGDFEMYVDWMLDPAGLFARNASGADLGYFTCECGCPGRFRWSV